MTEKSWYGSAYNNLKEYLQNSETSFVYGQSFLADYFAENILLLEEEQFDTVEDVEEYVRNEIDSFQGWLRLNAPDIAIGKRFRWGLEKVLIKNSADTSVAIILEPEESEADRKLIDDISESEIKILERVLAKYRNSNDHSKIHELSVKIASWYESNSVSSLLIAQYWESVISSAEKASILTISKYNIKAAYHYNKFGEYEKAGQLYEKSFELFLNENNYPNKLLNNKDLSFAVNISRKARSCYSNSLDSELESRIFIKECDLINDHNKGLKKAVIKCYRCVSHYGEAPGRVVITGI